MGNVSEPYKKYGNFPNVPRRWQLIVRDVSKRPCEHSEMFATTFKHSEALATHGALRGVPAEGVGEDRRASP